MACPFRFLKSKVSKDRPKNESALISEFTKFDPNSTILDTDLSDATEIKKQLTLLSLRASEARFAAKVGEQLSPFMDEITDQFYDALLENNHLKNIIIEHSTVERLKKTLRQHIVTMLNIHLNDAFMKKRRAIALKHVHIGLESRWYIGSFGKLQHILNEVIDREITDKQTKMQAISTVNKLLNFEQQIVLDTYERELNRKLVNLEREKKTELYQFIGMTTEGLAELSQNTSGSIRKVIARIDDLTSKAVLGNQLSDDSYRKSEQGAKVIHELTVNMDEVVQDTQAINGEVSQLRSISEEITRIVEIVVEIANQTNLLALNASIEAARAGEHGRGFDVVASEIRKLSDQTKTAVDEISGLINNSFNQVEKVTRRMKSIDHKTDRVNEDVAVTLENFQDIQQAMAKMRGASSEIASLLEEMMPVIHDIGDSAGRVADSAVELTSRSQQLVE